MLDRQDIDALFMGSLYGELSPSESTRLEQHLSAHPGDRMVLDGLGRARQALRDSHVLALQAEPPAAVSALLLQEAARRAPEPRTQRVGFFAKLTALLRHPATAAVAVVVLVAGVASTIYLRDGDRAMVEQEISTTLPATSPAIVPPVVAAGPAAEEQQDPHAANGEAALAARDQNEDDGVGSEDGYNADLDTDGRKLDGKEQETAKVKPKKERLAKATAPPAPPADELDRQGAAKVGGGGGESQKTADKGSKDPSRRYIEVTTPDPQPKTLADSRPNVTAGSGAGTATRTDRSKTGSVIVPADPGSNNLGLSGGDALTPGGTQGQSSAPQPINPTVDDATVKADTAAGRKAAHNAALAQHNKIVELVKANKCRDAAKAAGALYESNSDYYGEFVVNDRRVKACRSYIDVERKKRNEAMKSKSRAYQDSSEASPAPNTSNK